MGYYVFRVTTTRARNDSFLMDEVVKVKRGDGRLEINIMYGYISKKYCLYCMVRRVDVRRWIICSQINFIIRYHFRCRRYFRWTHSSFLF